MDEFLNESMKNCFLRFRQKGMELIVPFKTINRLNTDQTVQVEYRCMCELLACGWLLYHSKAFKRYGGPERTWCKYILSRYSDLASRYSDLTKSL